MIELLFTPEACRQEFAAIAVGLHDGDVALDRTAFHPTGQIRITKTEAQGQINQRLEIVLG